MFYQYEKEMADKAMEIQRLLGLADEDEEETGEPVEEESK